MNVIHGIALALATSVAIGFLGAMVLFFRIESGGRGLRGLLTVSILSATTVLWSAILHRDAIEPAADLIGSVLLLAAATLFGWAVATFGKARPAAAFSARPPSSFIERGPYAYVRHPFYLSYLFAFAGGCVLSGVAWSILVEVLLFVLYAIAARQEESQLLASEIGPAYRAYSNRVGRFVPKVPKFNVLPPRLTRNTTQPTRLPR